MGGGGVSRPATHLLATHNTRIALSRAAYRRENHCYICGHIAPFEARTRDKRICENPECRREADNANQRARYARRKGAA